jgi:predicted short-subunit dehydrogenase-like oxidoreductase (DUF2520 family)
MTGMYNWGVIAPGGIAEAQVADMQLAGLRIGAVASRSLDRAQALLPSSTSRMPSARMPSC